MAELVAEGADLVLRLRTADKVVAFHGDVRVPLRAVRAVRVPGSGWTELRGWRSSGLAIPGWMAKGKRRHGSGWDFSLLVKHGPSVVVELNGAEFERLVVSVDDGPTTAARVAAAAGIAFTPPAAAG